MNDIIKKIINSDLSNKEKEEKLNNLSEDIKTAKDIISGKFKYCSKCDDYYLAKSFLSDSETKKAQICTYVDPINSGGNDYADGFVDIKYIVCPKGHKHEIERKERLK